MEEEDQEDELTQFSDFDRAFINAFLSRRSITETEAIEIISKLYKVEGKNDPVEVLPAVQKLNSVLDDLGMTINISKHQDSGEMVYTMINTVSNSITMLATAYAPEEIAIFKEIIDLVFTKGKDSGDDEGYVEYKDILRSRQVNAWKISIDGLKRLIYRLGDEDWLKVVTDGNRISCTPSHRALIELEGIIKDKYGPDGVNTLKSCRACHKIFTKGKRCKTRTCAIRLHDHCVNLFYMQQTGSSCPVCKADLDEAISVGL